MVLREIDGGDVDLIFGLNDDPEVMRFLNGGKPASRAEIEGEVLPRWLRCYQRSPEFGVWAAVERNSDRFLGVFLFRPAEDTPLDDVELGYRLHKFTWGKGYATEGSVALIRKGFAELGVRRVWAQTMTVNTGSRRVMEKAGLRYVRTFFVDWPEGPIEGSEHGDVEYAITREEWSAQSG